MNPFSILGVANNAPISECQAAYRKLAMQYHPDRNKSSGAEEKFKQIKTAWEKIQSGFKWVEPTSAPKPTVTRKQNWSVPEDVGWGSRPAPPVYPNYSNSARKPITPQQKFPEFFEPVIGRSHVVNTPIRNLPSSFKAKPIKEKFYGEFNANVDEKLFAEGYKVEIEIDGAMHVFDIPPNAPFDLQRKMSHADGYVTITPRRL